MKHVAFFIPLLASFILTSPAKAQQPGGLALPPEAAPRFDPGALVLPPEAAPPPPAAALPPALGAAEGAAATAESAPPVVIPRASAPRPGSSDIGLQRPVSVKRRGFDYFIGFDSRIFYSSNPSLSETNDPFEIPAGIFQNNLHTGLRLGSYNWGRAAFSPYVGASYARFDHFGDESLNVFDYSTFGGYGFGLLQFPNGWAIRAGLNYYQDRESNDGDRIYDEINPGITFLKTFSLGKAVSVVDFGVSHHFSDSVAYAGIGGEDALDRTEYSARWTVTTNVGRLEFSPYARLAFLDYRNGNQADRRDFMREFGLSLEYPVNDFISASLFARYLSRLSEGGPASYDFERFDGGTGASLQAKF